MRLPGIFAAMFVPLMAASLVATAQPITATPLMPPTAQPSPMTQPQADPPSTVPQPTPQTMQLTWLPQGSALLQVLDKINAQNAVLTVKVGQTAQFASLSIQVQACSIHPPDQPQDAAAFLMISDSRADAPGFRGWILANNPSLSMLQHPIYDVRVVGCRT